MSKKINSHTLWDRQKRETAKPYAAFAEYRNMGPQRSISKVSKKLRKARSLIERWSKTHNWVKRAQAWDQFLDKHNQERIKDEITQMNKRHLKIAEKALDLVKSKLESIKNPAKELTIPETIRLYELAERFERLARGAATSQEETKIILCGYDFDQEDINGEENQD